MVPLGWSYNQALDTIDGGGRDFANTRKFRNARDNPKVTLVIDDVLPPWRPRAVIVAGDAEALTEAPGPNGEPLGAITRIHPVQFPHTRQVSQTPYAELGLRRADGEPPNLLWACVRRGVIERTCVPQGPPSDTAVAAAMGVG